MAIPVKTAAATQQPIEETISLVSNILADEQVEIRPEMSGLIESVEFSEGQSVAKGQLLVQIDDAKLEAQLAEARANFELAKANQARSEQLIKSKTVSKQEFDQTSAALAAARAALDLVQRQAEDTKVRAPFDGITAARLVSPGQYVETATVLTTLVSLVPVKAQFQVPERFISTLREGQKVELSVVAFPGETFAGEVYFVSPRVDQTTRTVEVRARVPNVDRRLKPGMFAHLELVLSVRPDGIVIPEEALTVANGKPAVFVVADGIANVREVKTGLRLPGKVEITEGLKAGEEVIIAGLQKVRPGGKVAVGEKPGSGGRG